MAVDKTLDVAQLMNVFMECWGANQDKKPAPIQRLNDEIVSKMS